MYIASIWFGKAAKNESNCHIFLDLEVKRSWVEGSRKSLEDIY